MSTITDPFSGNVSYTRFLEKESLILSKKIFANSSEYISFPPIKLLLLETASSTARSSWTGLCRDFFLIKKTYGINTIRLFLKKFPNKSIDRLIDSLLRFEESGFEVIANPFLGLFKEVENLVDLNSERILTLGQLSIKSEAAGKERVFALVDI